MSLGLALRPLVTNVPALMVKLQAAISTRNEDASRSVVWNAAAPFLSPSWSFAFQFAFTLHRWSLFAWTLCAHRYHLGNNKESETHTYVVWHFCIAQFIKTAIASHKSFISVLHHSQFLISVCISSAVVSASSVLFHHKTITTMKCDIWRYNIKTFAASAAYSRRHYSYEICLLDTALKSLCQTEMAHLRIDPRIIQDLVDSLQPRESSRYDIW